MAAPRAGADARITPVPVPADPISRAREQGIDLQIDTDRYVMRFQLAATDLACATERSLTTWGHSVESCGLPDWPLVAMTVEERSQPVSRDLAPAGTQASPSVSPATTFAGNTLKTKPPTSDFETIRAMTTAELLASLITPRPQLRTSPGRQSRSDRDQVRSPGTVTRLR